MSTSLSLDILGMRRHFFGEQDILKLIIGRWKVSISVFGQDMCLTLHFVLQKGPPNEGKNVNLCEHATKRPYGIPKLLRSLCYQWTQYIVFDFGY